MSETAGSDVPEGFVDGTDLIDGLSGHPVTAHTDTEILTAIESALKARDFPGVAALLHALAAQAPDVAALILGAIRRGEACAAQYGSNPDLCYQAAGHPGTHSNRYGTTWAS